MFGISFALPGTDIQLRIGGFVMEVIRHNFCYWRLSLFALPGKHYREGYLRYTGPVSYFLEVGIDAIIRCTGFTTF